MKAKRGICGELIELPLGARYRPLDGFFVGGDKSRPAVVIVHGMHSNFYRSAWKKALLRECARQNVAALSFNNRGAEAGTNDECFQHSLADISAALCFLEKRGHRSVVLVGHSTGCQKATYYQSRRQDTRTAGIVLLALCDDRAIMRQDLGRAFAHWVQRARRLVVTGRGGEPLGAPTIPPFTARRFLSIADPTSIEARLFDLSDDGPRGGFEQLRCPILCVLAGRDEYQTMPPRRMITQLEARYRGPSFTSRIIERADHGFHGVESTMACAVLAWVLGLTSARQIEGTLTGRSSRSRQRI